MKFKLDNDNFNRIWSFNGSISYSDIANLRLDHMDKMLMKQEPETAADCLLTLEMLFRRYEEQNNEKQEA